MTPSSSSTEVIRRLAGVAVLGIALTAPAACGGADTPTQSPTTIASSSSSPTPTRARPRPASTARLERSIDKVVRAHPEADIALAFAPVGNQEKVRVVGDDATLVAWSTIKVPLSLAVVRAGDGGARSGDIDSALTASDNEAASRLWEDLGSGESASAAVETQLHRGGDRATQVPPEVTSPGHSPFGQAKWQLDDQARFTAALPCLSGSSRVTDAMDRVVDGQRWGLGGINGAKLKGGWGSTPDGYVVRQLGIVPGTKGATAVTLQVRTGTHGQGTAIADQLVVALRTNRDQLPVGTCG